MRSSDNRTRRWPESNWAPGSKVAAAEAAAAATVAADLLLLNQQQVAVCSGRKFFVLVSHLELRLSVSL